MTVTELRDNIGKFGLISAKTGEIEYSKMLHGYIKDMDTRGKIWFVDTEGYGYAIKASQIASFEVKEFEQLPTEYKGREIYYEAGRAYFKDNNRECDIKK
jgi:hypothetical protein